jgi:hypothetical protein
LRDVAGGAFAAAEERAAHGEEQKDMSHAELRDCEAADLFGQIGEGIIAARIAFVRRFGDRLLDFGNLIELHAPTVGALSFAQWAKD